MSQLFLNTQLSRGSIEIKNRFLRPWVNSIQNKERQIDKGNGMDHLNTVGLEFHIPLSFFSSSLAPSSP